ncbi:MAG: S41 family peptidase, partial [Flavobacteriales bacterium]
EKLVYAGERDGSWNLYTASIKREEEDLFHLSTAIKEETLLKTDKETFQPAYSPDGKEVAFLEERTELKVLNTKTGNTRTILPGDKNYSYSDGDQWYEWSPDGEWFLVKFIDNNRWSGEAGLVKASGKEDVINLTESGYEDARPQWMMGGDMMICMSAKFGERSHGSWGSEMDVMGMFMNQDAYDVFNMGKAEYKRYKKEQKKKKEEKEEKKKEDKKADVNIEMDGIKDRVERLTIHSSNLSDAVVGPKGEKLFYLSKFEKGHDLWMHDFYKDKTKLMVKMKGAAHDLQISKDGKKLFVISRGRIYKIKMGKKAMKKGKMKPKPIKISAEMKLKPTKERRYIFNHAWRQTKKKFYKKNLHGVDWKFYKKEYKKFLPHINNGHDFAEMLSEMLGELNASHTGARYYSKDKMGDKTASLGIFFDREYEGDGLKVKEVMDESPVIKSESEIKPGIIIEAIDGNEIEANENFYHLLNRKAGKNVLLSLRNPNTGETWEEVVEPVSLGKEKDLLYKRWVKRRRELTDSLSNGKIGYVHIKGMDDPSFRDMYEKAMGKYHDRKALVVDTRFNGGGWLHDDVVTFLNGKRYLKFLPRGQDNLGGEPMNKWTKPSVMVMSEGNYSDAYMTPYVYKELGVGELVGMPVPGTGTAVWWEQQINGSIVFGIPQIGMQTNDGKLLENNEIFPDHKVRMKPSEVAKGRDEQIEKSVEILLEKIKE